MQVTEEVPLVETGSATLGKVVETRRVQNLPLNGRNPFALARFIPRCTELDFAGRGVRISTRSTNKQSRRAQ